MKVIVGQKVKFISGFYKNKEGVCVESNFKSHTFDVEGDKVGVSTQELNKYVKVI